MIENISDISWEDFITDTYLNKNSDFIYRGQSNSISNSKFEQWGLVSTFNRHYSNENFRFDSFLSQQLENSLFLHTYKDYEFVKRTHLDKSDLITKLYFLQHYGIPTSLIDFSLNPLVALYFAITSLRGHSGGEYDNEGFPKYYPPECKVTIYRINHRILKDKLGIMEINNQKNSLFLNYEKYRLDLSSLKSCYLGLDVKPHEKINKNVDNYNLKQQDGAFILFDNANAKNYDLIRFLIEYCHRKDIIFSEPLIKIYNIKYNSLYKPKHSKQPNYKPVFRFLEEQGITGKTLFNDFQSIPS